MQCTVVAWELSMISKANNPISMDFTTFFFLIVGEKDFTMDLLALGETALCSQSLVVNLFYRLKTKSKIFCVLKKKDAQIYRVFRETDWSASAEILFSTPC